MSDSHLNAPCDIVIGTAGHIDHGKTSLVRALTGIDTDRLAEEKRRGISIDLGFAHFTLPGGQTVSFVDVPGHERFVKNMLAGACGMEAVLLIVAADESVKPQTREHFDICRLLGIERGIVVLTKSDLATDEQLAATRAAVDQLRAGSFLAAAPVIPVSVVTRQGLAELANAITELIRTRSARDSGGFPRLPLDRSFALKGFGAVVTGTLWRGTLRVGDTVRLQPTSQEARIRGLQVHGKSVQSATAGQRTAVNLSGIEHTKVQRGFVLVHPKHSEITRTVQASMLWLAGAELPGRHEDFLVHIGTSEVTARVRLLSPASENRASLVQLNLSEPVVALPLDRFVLRRPSPSQTVGGGTVIDPFPPRRLNRSKTLARLERLAATDLRGRLSILVEEKENGRRLDDLARLTGSTPEEIKSACRDSDNLLFIEAAQRVVSPAWLRRRRELLVHWLQNFHARNPSLAGAPVAQARLNLDPPLANFVFHAFPAIRITGDSIALAAHKPEISQRETGDLLRLEQAFRKAGYQPAALPEVLKDAAVDPKNGRALLEKLVKTGKLVRVSDDLIFHADVLTHIRTSLAVHRGRRFSVPEFKDWTKISRKYAIPLLEYLDHQHVTRREGDNRVVL